MTAAAQALVECLVTDGQLQPSPLLEVQRSYQTRASGASDGWTVVFVDLTCDTELRIGSDWSLGTLLVNRPWRYRDAQDGGMEILPDVAGGPLVAPAPAVVEAQTGRATTRARAAAKAAAPQWQPHPAAG